MATLSQSDEKAFSFLQDACKQLLTLSTGVVGLTVTFFKEFTNGPDDGAQTLIQCSRALFMASIVSGLICLFCLTGQLLQANPTIKAANVTLTAGIQQLLFAAALLLAVIAGANAIGAAAPSDNPTTGTTTQSPPTIT